MVAGEAYYMQESSFLIGNFFSLGLGIEEALFPCPTPRKKFFFPRQGVILSLVPSEGRMWHMFSSGAFL